MSQSPEMDRERAETEAATWLVLLAEEPTDRDLTQRFQDWHAAHPLHAELWQRTVRAYQLAGKTVPAGLNVVSFPPRPPAGSQRLRPVLAAAVAAIAACLLLLAAPPLLLRLEADHLTTTAEVRTLTLPDGTVVRVGAESAIAVDFTSTDRRVRLLKGEAFFDVVPDAARPFSVAASDVKATALGTSFEVSMADTGRIGVAVQHGRVRVESGVPPVSENLVAGDWVVVGGPIGLARGRRPLDEIGAWQGGELVARDRPMVDVVDALRRYYDGRIVVQDGAFARTRVTGIYDLRDPVATLRSLASSHDAAMHRVSPWLLIVTAK